MLYQVFPDKSNKLSKVIFFDTEENNYYNARTDIYLSKDDIQFYKLRPIELVNKDHAAVLCQKGYFIEWNLELEIEIKMKSLLKKIKSVYPTVEIYEEPESRLIEGIINICKSLFPTQTWNGQSDVSTTQG